jgi:hypothetical protein
MFRAIQGRNPASDNYFDQGQAKMIYDIDISPLIKSAQDGKVDCDLSRGIHANGLNLTGMQVFQKLAKGERVADCPTLISVLPVKDITSGGPHWGALDNHTIDQHGVPWRMTFSNYFVSRTGVDGDHRFYNVNIAPDGKLSYDENFRDENTGALGVNFNRRDWPGNPDAGFYKPHSELWVCPPGICTADSSVAYRATAASSSAATKKCLARRVHAIALSKIKGQRTVGGSAKYNGKTVKAKKTKSGRWVVKIDLRKATKSVVKVVLKIRTAKGRTFTRTRTLRPCARAAAKKK